jgi:replicative DNA helicase
MTASSAHDPNVDRAVPGAAQYSEVEELLQRTFDSFDSIAGPDASTSNIPTGFRGLDEVMTGLPPGTLTVIGAHPGVGSSSLAVNIARFAAVGQDIATAYLTLDSKAETVLQRLLSAEAKIKLHDLRSGRMTDDDWARLAQITITIREAPISIIRPKDVEITAIVDLVNELVTQKGARFVVLDSLHLITARRGVPYENREREVAEVTRQLKRLALDADIALVVTAQLSSNPGPRMPAPTPPTLADLRDSGTIAHVADHVVLVHRPDAYERDDPRGGEVDLILAKNRFGPTAVITVAHQLHISRFVDIGRG